MKLCQKCIDQIKKEIPWDADRWNGYVDEAYEVLEKPVSEGECEFWAHKALRKELDPCFLVLNEPLSIPKESY